MKVEILDQDVVWRDLEGEVVILNLATATYFGLEGIGNDIWRYLAEHQSTDQLVETLCAEYDVSPDEMRADLDRFLRELSEKGLVRLSEDPKPAP